MFQYQRGGYCLTGSDTASGVYYTTKGNGIALFTRRTGGLGGKEGAEGDEGKWFGSFALALILFHKNHHCATCMHSYLVQRGNT